MTVSNSESTSTTSIHAMDLGERATAVAPSTAPVTSQRVVAVDVGRGYTMALLITIPFLLQLLRALPDSVVNGQIQKQLTHSKWHGSTYYDMGLPAFIYMVGMSISLSLWKVKESGRVSRRTYYRIFRRALILFLLGIFANGGFNRHWPDIRIAGVLQRIAICYFVGSLVYLNFGKNGRITIVVSLLLGYWALLAFVPVPGYGAENWTFEGNLAAYVDQNWLPGRPQFEAAGWDAEGIVSTLGAIATCVLGTIVVGVYFDDRWTPRSISSHCFLLGSALMLLGYTWSEWVPMNKMMWTPSFTLFCAGQSTICLAVINLVTDVWKKNWFFPFVVIGQNSLIAYLAVIILPFEDVAKRLVGGDIQRMLGAGGTVLLALVQLALCWWLLYWLYRKGLTMKF